MPVLGLTGPVGAGKTTASGFLRDLGCVVLDVDRMGHEALDDPAVRRAVVAEFGPGVAEPGGGIDRRALARRVFGDPQSLRRLEAIVHPAVRARLAGELGTARAARPRAVVVDCALLFEGGVDALCDRTVVVDAPEAVRHRRVAARHGWTPEETRRREAAQLSATEKRSRADRVIENDGSAEDLRARIGALLDEVAPAMEGVRPGAGPGRSVR